MQRVQAVVDTFFVELEGKLRFLFEDPRIVAAGAVVVVVLLALVVVLTELFNVSYCDLLDIQSFVTCSLSKQ